MIWDALYVFENLAFGIRVCMSPELGTLEWITFNPNYLIKISIVETFNFSP